MTEQHTFKQPALKLGKQRLVEANRNLEQQIGGCPRDQTPF